MFEWIFQRQIGPYPTDKWFFMENGRLMGGTALNYRNLAGWRGQVIRAAIIGSSFTLPEFQGRGLFSEMVALTIARAQALGLDVYFAFVRKNNPSYGRLIAAGCRDIPSWYCSLDTAVKLANANKDVTVLEAESSTLRQAAFVLRDRPLVGRGRFKYTYEEWESQFIHRPRPGNLLLVFEGSKRIGHFVVDEDDFAIRLLEVSWDEQGFREDIWRTAIGYGSARKSRITAFTTDVSLLQMLTEMGFSAEQGSVTALATDQGAENGPDLETLFVHSGDRV